MNNLYNVLTSFGTMVDYRQSYGNSDETSPLGPYDFSQLTILEEGLIKMGKTFEKKRLYDGWQIVCEGWDAVIHCGSYGHEWGDLEIYGDIVQSEDDDVEGYLTAVDILLRLV